MQSQIDVQHNRQGPPEWLFYIWTILMIWIAFSLASCTSTRKFRNSTVTKVDSSSKKTFTGVTTTVINEKAQDSVTANPGNLSAVYDWTQGAMTIEGENYDVRITPLPDTCSAGAAPGTKPAGSAPKKYKVDVEGKNMKVPVNINRTTTITQAGTTTDENHSSTTVNAKLSSKEKTGQMGGWVYGLIGIAVLGLLAYACWWCIKHKV